MIQIQTISSELRPLAVTKRQAFKLLNMPKLVQRWLYWSREGRSESPWVEIVVEGTRGRETVIDYGSLVAAYERYKRGEQPPPMPSGRCK